MQRMLCAVALFFSASLAFAAAPSTAPPMAPFDKALLAENVPDDPHEARVLIAVLKQRYHTYEAKRLASWIIKRDTRRLFGESTTQVSIQQAISDPESGTFAYNRATAERFARTFPVDFSETASPDVSQGPEGTVAKTIAPGVVEWIETNPARHIDRFDATVRVANELDAPIKLRVQWFTANAFFTCGPVDLAPGSSMVVTCSASATNVSSDKLLAGMVALRQGNQLPQIMVRQVQAPSRGVKLIASRQEVFMGDDEDIRRDQAENMEAAKRLASVPCESLNDCEQQRAWASGPHGSRIGQFFIWALGFAGALVFRIYRPAPAKTSATVLWVIYAFTGVLAIGMALADPPQTGGGDGIAHGALGQLLMYALGAPWSLIIAQGHGHDAGTVSGFLMMAVLANIIYGGAHVYLRQHSVDG